MDGQVRIDDQHQGETSHPRDRHKVRDRIIVQVLVYEWVSGQRRVGPHQERIAVRWLMVDIKSGQRSIRSRAILDEDRLAEYRAELVGDDAANRVTGAARAEYGNDGDRPRRIIVGIKRRTEQCSYGGHQNDSKFFHASFLPGCRELCLLARRSRLGARLFDLPINDDRFVQPFCLVRMVAFVAVMVPCARLRTAGWLNASEEATTLP